MVNFNLEFVSLNGFDVFSVMNYEFGYCVMFVDGFVFDVSVFRIDFDDKIEII